ncbi:MAG: RNA polymerase factor sigma-54 [bacterium]
MEQTIQQIQRQQLIFTQVFQQAIHILQLSTPQLVEEIETELMENPVLELEGEEIEEKPKQKAEDPEIDWEKYLEKKDDFPAFGTVSDLEWEPNYENLVTQTPSLREHLLGQLRTLSLTEKEFFIGRFLIGEIDDNGYLSLPLESLAASLKEDVSELEKMLTKIQGFDPPGVGSRDLKECLEIQAKELGWDNTPIITLIRNHLEDIYRRRYDKIVKEMNIPLAQVKELIKDLSTLEPKPGRLYENEAIVYVTPDVIVEEVDNEFVVSLNDREIPKLRIGSYYKDVLKQDRLEEGVAKYIREKIKSAAWFRQCIIQRKNTLMKVAKTIFNIQDGFLRIGPRGLKPLKLEDVAKRVELDATTVSRAISNKFAQTPWGMLPLKYFFDSGLDRKRGEQASSIQVKERIKTLIEKEDPKRPLSDSKITKLLQKEGIKVARRTVSKYREEIGVRASYLRREIT